MEFDAILEEMTTIFRDIFEDNEIILDSSTGPDDITDWDSLVNISLLVEIEKHFKLKFSTTEILTFSTVGDIALAVLNPKT